MSNPPDRNEPLEQFIDATLRELPLRRAPEALSARVLSTIERRATLHWWRRPFDNWPAAAQYAFIAGSAALAAIVIYASSGMPSLSGAFRLHVGSSSLAVLFKALITLHASIAASLPASWINATIALVAIVYFIALGIGAIAYRTLYASR